MITVASPLPQPAEWFCDYCGEPASSDDWSDVAAAVICPSCMEHMANENANACRAELGLVGSCL